VFSVVAWLPSINAALNATATVLLVSGFILIKQGREQPHKWTMLAAFVVSMAFLTCYLIYHSLVGHVKFAGPESVARFYHGMLISHILLAITVPVLAGRTIYLGLRDRRPQHRRWAVWTFPIWLYVSITGVLIYVMLYHLYPAGSGDDKINTITSVMPGESAK
jgi:putative membrane protein